MDNFEQTVLLELGEIKALCATNAAKQEESEHRIDSIEKTNSRQYWLHAISPAVLALAGIARKLGIA
jgi:hypothetical protein